MFHIVWIARHIIFHILFVWCAVSADEKIEHLQLGRIWWCIRSRKATTMQNSLTCLHDAPESFSQSFTAKRRFAHHSKSDIVSSVCNPTSARTPGPIAETGVGFWLTLTFTEADFTRCTTIFMVVTETILGTSSSRSRAKYDGTQQLRNFITTPEIRVEVLERVCCYSVLKFRGQVRRIWHKSDDFS